MPELVTSRIREDVPRPPLADRVDEPPELGIDLMGSVIRYGQWDADADTLGSARFEQVRESIADRAGATPGGPGNAPDWRDWEPPSCPQFGKMGRLPYVGRGNPGLRRRTEGQTGHLGNAAGRVSGESRTEQRRRGSRANSVTRADRCERRRTAGDGALSVRQAAGDRKARAIGLARNTRQRGQWRPGGSGGAKK